MKRGELKKKLGFIAALALLSGVAIYQNCSGTRTRSADFSISQEQVDSYISDLQCAISGASSVPAATSNAVNALVSLEGQEGSAMYYGEAPSSMGDISIVAPLDYNSLRYDGGGLPQQIYAFFVLSASGTGSLVIALSDTGSSAVNSSPTPGNITVAVKHSLKPFASNHLLDATTSAPTCSSSNPLNLTTAIAAFNDGSGGLETASFDGDIFEMELLLNGTTTLIIRSYDIQDGDLQGTIQLEVNKVDQNSGQEIFLGDINLTQPD
jgi:hypothetical protein